MLTKRSVMMWVIGGLLAGAPLAFADDEPANQDRDDQPIPAEKQKKLLEKYGEEGIDANEDGTLTRKEVRDFFAKKYPDRQGKKRGEREGKGERRGERKGGGRGQQGRWGQGRGGFPGQGMRPGMGMGQGDRIGNMLNRLEMLDPTELPKDFDLSKHQKLDTDGNGELSLEEWAAFATETRAKILAKLLEMAPEIDADENGEISDEELAAFKKEREAKMRAKFLIDHPEADTDSDGTLSEEEFEAFQETMRAQRLAKLLEKHPEADLDGDGTLTEEEARKFMEKNRPQGQQRGPGRHFDGQGPHGPRGDGPEPPAEEE